MTENPGQWGPQGQGGYPPQGPGGYPPQQQPGGYPPQQPGGAIRLSSLPAIRLSRAIRLSSRVPEAIRHSVPTHPSRLLVDIRRSRQGGIGPQGPAAGAPGTPGCTNQEEPSDDHRDRRCGNRPAGSRRRHHHGADPGRRTSSRMSRSPRASPHRRQSSQPRSPQGSQRLAEPQPTPTQTSQPPTGGAIDLGNGIELNPAAGWQVKKTGENVAQLSDGKSVFLGQSLQISPVHQPWPAVRCVAPGCRRGYVQRQVPGLQGRRASARRSLKAATCVAEVTVSGGQGSTKLYLFSLVSVRQSDGVTVIGTAYFTPNTDTDQLNKDFTSMINSMLKSQAAGG